MEALNGSEVWRIKETPENELIIGTKDGIYKLNSKSELQSISQSEASKKAKYIEIHDKKIYTVNYSNTLQSININGTHRVYPGNYRSLTVSNNQLILTGLPTGEKPKHALVLDSENISVISSSNKIFTISEDALKTYSKNLSETSSMRIKKFGERDSAFVDSKGNIWIIYSGEGLTFISHENNLINNLDIAPLNDKNIWHVDYSNSAVIFSSDDPVVLFQDRLGERHFINTGLNGVKSSIILSTKSFVTSGQNGMYHFRFSGEAWEGKKLNNQFITTTHLNKNQLYYATIDGSIYSIYYDELSDTIIQTTTKLIIEVDDIPIKLLAHENELYIGSMKGLYKSSNSHTSLARVSSGNPVVNIKGYNNEIYFATTSGIFNVDNNSPILSSENPIYSFEISHDFIWASSQGEIIAKSLYTNTSYILNSDFGAQSEYHAPSSSLYGEGKYILFGGTNGISRVEPSKIINYFRKALADQARIEKLKIFNKEISDLPATYLNKAKSINEEITLNYSDYPFSLKFESPKSQTQASINFYYKLEGIDDNWISSDSNRTATYTNIPSGTYILSFYSGVSGTTIKSPLSNVRINITPPIWKTNYAKTTYVFLALLISFFFFKAYVRNQKNRALIAQSEERLKLSLWGSGDEMWDWDIDKGTIFRSNIWGSLEFPQDGQRNGGHSKSSNIHPHDRERVNEALELHFKGNSEHFESTYRVKNKQGNWMWILDRAKVVERDGDDNPTRMTGTIKDINEFKVTEERLTLFARAIENISEGMFILSNDFDFVEVNDACCEILKVDRHDLIRSTLQFSRYPNSYTDKIKQILRGQGQWSGEIDFDRGDATSFLMEVSIDAIYNDLGELTHYVGVFSDISLRKQQEDELRRLTNNDLLTGLPNRSNLLVSLANLVRKNNNHMLMVMDLDNFKRINDSHGHGAGDTLLIETANRLQDAIGPSCNVYRIGGDEFAVLLDNQADAARATYLASRICEEISKPIRLEQGEFIVGASIGIVRYPEDAESEQSLLRKADMAMYFAKSKGGAHYKFYSESLNKNATRVLEIETLIRDSLKNDYFEVYYQPKINLSSGNVSGMEALVRINHPQKGFVSPGEFIPLAEENGLIIEIGEVVLKKSCFAAKEWLEKGLLKGRVAVNLSSKQFELPDLRERISNILKLTELPPQLLELEITEGTVIEDPEKAIDVMRTLSDLGINLALDDFGTGYSSLSYLKKFPIDTLKIDKAFIDDIDSSERDLKMVDSIITIAHNMGLKVVGEGVEQSSQRNILKALKCEEMQGFLFSKPLPEKEFESLLKASAEIKSTANA
ncbi:diguanylate cyclase [Paraferrimonas sedimenticola]|uniref:Diguanylate cyclase n=1 Tax=Paraferrimonas sedimenticola TaxID=375674 RepID=A0AA37RWE9_9GAMM|nr:diguanylate cyclase [Paraferrimonas sedimenticola]